MHENIEIAASALDGDDARDLINLVAEKLEEKIHDTEQIIIRHEYFKYSVTKQQDSTVKLKKYQRLHKLLTALKASLRCRKTDPRTTLRRATSAWERLDD